MDDDERVRWLSQSGELMSHYSEAVGQHVGRMASINADLRSALARERRRTTELLLAVESAISFLDWTGLGDGGDDNDVARHARALRSRLVRVQQQVEADTPESSREGAADGR